MKKRNGFVSNSSSSSFLIYGIVIEPSELLNALDISKEEFEDKHSGSTYDLLDTIMEDVDGFEWHDPWDDGCFIGASWSSVKDDETGAEFKTRVEKTLREKFGASLKYDTHEGAWHD